MGIGWPRSIPKHSIPDSDALYAMQNAIYTSERVKVNDGGSRNKRRVFIGPQHAQTDRLITSCRSGVTTASRGGDRMTLSKKDQERYATLAALEEQPTETSTAGESAHGANAAEIGQQLLLGALGNAKAVQRAVGGRPRVGGVAAGAGSSPTLRVRVTATRKQDVTRLREQLEMKNDSDVVRAALDEYVERHLQASA